MKDLFDGVLPFFHTAKALSFSKAAEQLGVTPAAISKAVSRLEQQLGVRLLHRTTRKVSLSDEGERFLVRVGDAIAQVRVAKDEASRTQRAPQGELIVSAPFVLGRYLAARLPVFCGRHPAIEVQLRFSDRRSRLVDDRVDVALRVGELHDSSLVARRLFDTRWCTAASPAYLARSPYPEHPGELGQHDCLRFRSPRGKPVQWTFLDRPGGRPRTWPVTGSVLVDQGELLVEIAARGHGIVQAFEFMVRPMLADGRLLALMPEYATSGPSVFAVFLPDRRRSPKVRAFVDFLATTPAPGLRSTL